MKLIINADDLNHATAINAGIIEGCARGVITSTTAIVNKDLSPSTSEISYRFSGVSVGLHFNLSRYGPVARPCHVRSLLTQNWFRSDLDRSEFLANVASFRPDEVRLELEAQFARFVEYFGKVPSHIDSHHYVHAFPPVRDVVLDYAARNGLPVRRPESRGPPVTTNERIHASTTDHLILGFGRHNDSLAYLRNALAGQQYDWVELACHVRRGEPANTYEQQRVRELGALCSESFRAILDELNVQLRTYADFTTARAT